MTEKDAVKCMSFAQKNWWYVPVEAEIKGEKVRSFLQNLMKFAKQYEVRKHGFNIIRDCRLSYLSWAFSA